MKPFLLLLLLGTLLAASSASAATVRIPDPKFLQRLVALGYDKDGDGRI